MRRPSAALVCGLFLATVGAARPPGSVDAQRLQAASAEPGNWLTAGRDQLRGAVAPKGMERFDDVLTEQDVDGIHAYLTDQAWKAYK